MFRKGEVIFTWVEGELVSFSEELVFLARPWQIGRFTLTLNLTLTKKQNKTKQEVHLGTWEEKFKWKEGDTQAMEAKHYSKHWCYYGGQNRHKPLIFHGAYVLGRKEINIISR